MKTYDVLLTKTKSANVRIQADNAQEAEDFAFELFMDCEIELTDNGIPGEVSIVASEVGMLSQSPPAMISIYWDDLTPAKQIEILAAFGHNCRYDVCPIAEIPKPEEESE